jgi:bile acid:Na+ symporter, BASS family
MSPSAFILPTIKASLVLTVLGVGLHSTPRDAAYLFRHPGLLAKTLVAMNVVMPLFALWLAVVFTLEPAVKLALVALSLSPVPPFLPPKVAKSGGEAAYNVGLLAAVSLFAIAIIPVSVHLLGLLFDLPFQVRWQIVARLVGATILVPLALGIGLRQFVPSIAERIAKPTTVVASVLLVASFLPILVRAWPEIVSLIGNGTLAAIVAITLAGLAVGHLLGGPQREDRVVLALATASRHPAVALAIATAVLPNIALVGAAVLLALLVCAVVSLPYTMWSRRRARAAGDL